MIDINLVVFDCRYIVTFIRLRELAMQTCEYLEIGILKGGVSQDYVRLLVSALVILSPSEIMQRIKELHQTKLFQEFPRLKKLH